MGFGFPIRRVPLPSKNGVWGVTCYVMWNWNLCACEELRRKEVVAVAPMTSLTRLPLGRRQQTLTRSLVYETLARSGEVCFVGGGIVAVSIVSQLVEVERLSLVRCIRHTPMHQSTAEALGWQLMVSCAMCSWTSDDFIVMALVVMLMFVIGTTLHVVLKGHGYYERPYWILDDIQPRWPIYEATFCQTGRIVFLKCNRHLDY